MSTLFMYNDTLYYYNKETRDFAGKEYSFFIIRDKVKHDKQTNLFYKKILDIEEYFEKNKFNDISIMNEELKIVAKSYAKFFKVIKYDNELIVDFQVDVITSTFI